MAEKKKRGRPFITDPAQILAQKFNRRQYQWLRYRRLRDRKLMDWLGRTYKWWLRDELTGNMQELTLRLVGYDPQKAMVHISAFGHEGSITWGTDDFWAALKLGALREV